MLAISSYRGNRHTVLTIASGLPLSFDAVYVRPTWTHASSRGPVPVLVTGVSPLPASPRIWNSLPPDLRRPGIELGEFRRLLKTFSVCLGTADTAEHRALQ